jgi:hypothetical protein
MMQYDAIMKLKSTEQNRLLRNKLFSENKNFYLQLKKNLSTISNPRNSYHTQSRMQFTKVRKSSYKFCMFLRYEINIYPVLIQHLFAYRAGAPEHAFVLLVEKYDNQLS